MCPYCKEHGETWVVLRQPDEGWATHFKCGSCGLKFILGVGKMREGFVYVGS